MVAKRVRGLAPTLWTFLLEHFHYINILRFIPYLQHFVIPLKFIVKLSPLLVVFSHKGFHINLVFFSLFSYFFIVSLIITFPLFKMFCLIRSILFQVFDMISH